MPTKRIPLVGPPNTRNIDPVNSITKDQIFKSVLFDVIDNPMTKTRVVYANKRPGFKLGSSLSNDSTRRDCEDNDGFNVLSGPCSAGVISIVPTTFRIYIGTTTIGNIAGGMVATDICITKAIIGGEEHYLIAAGEGGMFYVGETGMTGGLTFTGDTTNGSATVANVSSFTGLVVGQYLSGTGIPSVGTERIQSLNPGGNSLVMTSNATATNTGVTITRTQMSKVIDADAPTQVIGPMIEMDGYIFVMQRDSQKIYQSDINSIASWVSTSFVTANITVGYGKGIARLKNNIIAVKVGGLEFFYNAGNASGSVLSPMKDSAKRFGASSTPVSLFDGAFQQFSYIDDFLFVAFDGVYMLSAGGVQPIHDPVVQRLIANTTKNSVMVRARKTLGKYYVDVAFSTTWSYTYDLSAGLWSQTGFPAQALISKVLGNVVYASADDFLHEYPWTSTGQTPVYQDDGASYTMTIQTGKLDFDTPNRKFVSRVELIGSDVQSSGTATLEASDDDFANFFTLGTFDMTQTRPFITPCGSHVGGRSYRLTHSANTAFRAQALEFTYTVASV